MFKSREEAAELLAQKLQNYKGKDAIILAVPRGGVVVGKTLAKKLSLPLDIVVTRKIGAPNQPELAIGAVGPEGAKFIDWGLAMRAGADEDYLKFKIEEQKKEVGKRFSKFRKGKKALELKGKIVIVTDDGIATGATIEAAVAWIRTKKPKKIILAVPVAPRDTVEKIKDKVEELIVLETPDEFFAVGQFYREFPQVTDEEVVRLLGTRQ